MHNRNHTSFRREGGKKERKNINTLARDCAPQTQHKKYARKRYTSNQAHPEQWKKKKQSQQLVVQDKTTKKKKTATRRCYRGPSTAHVKLPVRDRATCCQPSPLPRSTLLYFHRERTRTQQRARMHTPFSWCTPARASHGRATRCSPRPSPIPPPR